MAQAFEQLFVTQETGPRTDGLAVAIEDPDDRIGEFASISGVASTSGRTTDPARGIRTLEKSGVPPRPDCRFGHVEAQWSVAGHAAVVSRRTALVITY